MNNVRRQAVPPASSLLLLGLVVGLGTYAGRVWWHREVPPGLPLTSVQKPPSHLLTPRRITEAEAAEKHLPMELLGYRLVSVVPEVKGHDLHALYESDHHVSLFVRPIVPHPGEVRMSDVGRYWLPAESLLSHPAFVRTDVHHRSALAWIARGKRHVVTGDVSPEQLRQFAVAYEQALPR